MHQSPVTSISGVTLHGIDTFYSGFPVSSPVSHRDRSVPGDPGRTEHTIPVRSFVRSGAGCAGVILQSGSGPQKQTGM